MEDTIKPCPHCGSIEVREGGLYSSSNPVKVQLLDPVPGDYDRMIYNGTIHVRVCLTCGSIIPYVKVR